MFLSIYKFTAHQPTIRLLRLSFYNKYAQVIFQQTENEKWNHAVFFQMQWFGESLNTQEWFGQVINIYSSKFRSKKGCV